MFLYSQALYTKIPEVNLSAFAYRLFHEDMCCYKPGQSRLRIITGFPLFNAGGLRLQVNFNEMFDGMWSFTTASTGSCQGTLTGSFSGTLISGLNWNFDRKFNGNLDWTFIMKTNKNFDWKGWTWIGRSTWRPTRTLIGKEEYREGRWSPGLSRRNFKNGWEEKEWTEWRDIRKDLSFY